MAGVTKAFSKSVEGSDIMFINFFYLLKKEGIPVSITEWITLMEALDKGLAASSLTNFYYLARSILVKSETNFDKYDIAFQKHFEDIGPSDKISARVDKWLEEFLPAMDANIDSKDWLDNGSKDPEGRLKKVFEEDIPEQEDKRRSKPKMIGISENSPFVFSGRYNLGSIRMGGESQNLSAVKVAGERKYRKFRADEVLGVRQFQLALKKLRLLTTRMDGVLDEFDLEGTVSATSKNGGRLKLVWTRPPKNSFRIILLMDSGGSMMPYYELCNRLFTAVNKSNHFKSLEIYYFHNCVYHQVYKDAYLQDPMRIEELIQTRNPDCKLIFVGDASMAPSELTQRNGIIDWGMTNDDPGLLWLKRLKQHFQYNAWFNPIPESEWNQPSYATIQMVREVFPMFELTVDGMEKAVKKLKVRH